MSEDESSKKNEAEKEGDSTGNDFEWQFKKPELWTKAWEAKVFITRRMAFPDLCFGKMTGKVTES